MTEQLRADAEPLLEPDEALDHGADDRLEDRADGYADDPVDDGIGLKVVNNREFAGLYLDAKVHEGERGAADPGTLRVRGALEPWGDRPDNPDRDRYVFVPEAQRAVERRYAAFGFDDDTLALINGPDRYSHERQYNCCECARAVADMLNGQPRAARPLLDDMSGAQPSPGESAAVMEQALRRSGDYVANSHGGYRLSYDPTDRDGGGYDAGREVARGFETLHRDLLAAGPGAHAVVMVDWKPPPDAVPGDQNFGHAFNVANLDGRIRYVDAQRNEVCDADGEMAEEYRSDAARMTWIRAERKR